jgi:hypothetical protein
VLPGARRRPRLTLLAAYLAAHGVAGLAADRGNVRPSLTWRIPLKVEPSTTIAVEAA